MSTREGHQDQEEKKEHPRRDGSHRGQDDDDRFQDPQDLQARGNRSMHSQPGQKSNGEVSADDGSAEPTDNTRPGGNRTKGGHHTQGQVDHN
jgi:hypothetical protein